MKISIFFLIGIMLGASSCQNHLDREDAKRMIARNKNYPVTQSYEITKSFVENMHTTGPGVSIVLGEDKFKPQKSAILQFVSVGLLKLNKVPRSEKSSSFLGTTIRTWTTVKVTLTKSGDKYLIRENSNSFWIKLWETDIYEITGIREMDNNKTEMVNYTISNKNVTPFGAIFNDKNNITQQSTYFSLYDDGWRIN